MARAKEAVETFMELGAKYEVVLVGLADEVTKQRQLVQSAERNAAESAEKSASAATQLRSTQQQVSEVLAQMRETASRVERLREAAEATWQSLEDRLRELTTADQHQKHVTERLTRAVKRNALVVAALSVSGIAVGLLALLS
jgi:septal ring factor EnvC (AmiA/AmiB activator)